jgi:hypothetical protein
VRPKSFAGHRGKIFNLRREVAIEINKDQGNDENADTISRGKVMVGGKGTESFTPDLGGKNFDASGKCDNGRGIEAFDGANEIQSSGSENRRTNERKRDPPHHAELVGAEGLGRFFERGSMLFKAAATIKNAKGVKIKDSTKISPGME